jgi:hypothetical protein
VLPAFLLGLAVADVFKRHPEEQRRFRVVSFAFLTPIFSLKGGLNVDVGHLAAGAWPLLAFLVVKVATEFLGVLPAALRHVRPRCEGARVVRSGHKKRTSLTACSRRRQRDSTANRMSRPAQSPTIRNGNPLPTPKASASSPEISALRRGKLSGFSVDRLVRFLVLRGRDVQIVVKEQPRSRRRARLLVA